MDGEGPPTREDTLRNPDPGPPPILGCVPSGLGSSPPRPVGVGSMVTPGELITHQFPGVKGPVPGTPCFQAPCHRPPSDSDVGQFDCSRLCEQTGGMVSDSLCSLTGQLLRSTESNRVQLEARYLPGQSNVLTDLLSRRNQVLGAEWSLHPQVARDLLRKWGSPTLDLFATHLNAKLPLYCSLIPDPQALFEDAFWHPWDNLDTYSFPPLPTGRESSGSGQRDPKSLDDSSRPSLAGEGVVHGTIPLLTQPPLALLLWDRLLCQPHFHRFHGGVHTLNFHVWRLSSVPSESPAFREELLSNCPAVSESPLHAYTSRNGSLSVVLVVEEALLQSTPLYP